MANVLQQLKTAVQAMRRPSVTEPAVMVSSGQRPSDMPCYRINPPDIANVRSRHSGPDAGLCGAHRSAEEHEKCATCQHDWTDCSDRAYGIGLSLYDECLNGRTANHGDPVADVFGVVAYRNGAIVCVADGVNWGEKSRLAARCAVHQSLEYLERCLGKAESTQEVAAYILRSFDAAQKMIIEREATMTTLCTACVVQMEDGRWGLSTVIVGDSLLFVYSPATGHVREVTSASHGERDLRNAGGALGPSDGFNPDLSNLTCAFTIVDEGDIVFGATDGISDNFDPVVMGKVKTDRRPSPEERNAAMQENMAEVLRGDLPSGQIDHAKGLAVALLHYTVNQTDHKRRCLEDASRAAGDPAKEQELIKESQSMPGKLDHAAAVAVDVMCHQPRVSSAKRKQQKTLATEIVHL